MAKVKSIPDGYAALTPYLIVAQAARAIDFYKAAFGAVERLRMEGGGRVHHAELGIGGSVLMLADGCAETGSVDPHKLGGTAVSLLLYVENVDQVVQRAVDAGATLTRPVADQFYGDRVGSLEDPFGHKWHIATHTEDVSEEELQRRAAALHPPA